MKRIPLYITIIFCLVLTFCSSPNKLKTPGTSLSKVSFPMLDDNTFKLTEISTDETYGYSEKNAIMVGGVTSNAGPLNEQRFLNALLGPNGQKVKYARSGSCCPVKSKNAYVGEYGLLDRYEVSYDGMDSTINIYINMYDPGQLKAPKGFTFKQ